MADSFIKRYAHHLAPYPQGSRVVRKEIAKAWGGMVEVLSREGLLADALVGALGRLYGLAPAAHVRMVESDDLRFHFLFSCCEPPSRTPPGGSGAVKTEGRRGRWREYLKKRQILSNGSGGEEGLEMIEGLEESLDEARERNTDRPENDDLLEKRQKKKQISDRLAGALESAGGARCSSYTIEGALGTYSFRNRLITLYPRMMRMIVNSLAAPERGAFSCEGHTRRVTCLAVTEDGRLVSGDAAGVVRVWDFGTGHSKVLDCEAGVCGLAPAGGASVVVLCANGTARVWGGRHGRERQLSVPHVVRATALTYCGTSGVLDFGDGGGRLARVFSAGSYTPWDGLGEISCLAPYEGGSLVVGGEDGSLRILHPMDDKKSSTRLQGRHTGRVNGIAVLPDGRVVSAGSGAGLLVQDPSKRSVLALKEHRGHVNAVVVAPDGSLVSAGFDGTVRVWDLVAQKGCLLHDGNDPVNALTILPGKRLAAGSADGTIRVWDLATRRQIWRASRAPLEALKYVVAVHEAGHALWHVGLDANGDGWKNPERGTSELHETIAQHCTWRMVKAHAKSGHWADKELDRVFHELVARLAYPYRLFEHLIGLPGERVRAFLLGMRRGDPDPPSWRPFWDSVQAAINASRDEIEVPENGSEGVQTAALAEVLRVRMPDLREGVKAIYDLSASPAIRTVIERSLGRALPDRPEVDFMFLKGICTRGGTVGDWFRFSLQSAETVQQHFGGLSNGPDRTIGARVEGVGSPGTADK